MPADISRLLSARAREFGLDLPNTLRDRLLAYYQLLERWNQKINLTSLEDPGQAVDRLLIEPLLAARVLASPGRLVDLGSGGGSPAIPLALALHPASLVMVESRSRKAAFLREAARVLSLPATVANVRFEELRCESVLGQSAGLVSMRAVRPDEPVVELIQWLLAPRGVAAVFASAHVDMRPLILRATHPLVGSAQLLLLERST